MQGKFCPTCGVYSTEPEWTTYGRPPVTREERDKLREHMMAVIASAGDDYFAPVVVSANTLRILLNEVDDLESACKVHRERMQKVAALVADS